MEMHRCVRTKNSHASQHIQKSFKIQPEEGTQQEPNSGMGPAVAFVESGKNKGSRIVLGIMFSRFVLFFWICFSARFPCYLQHFGAGSCHFNYLCNILELEPLIFHRICKIFVEFVTFWSWKLPFQRYLQHF
jgi:hypothetical protein